MSYESLGGILFDLAMGGLGSIGGVFLVKTFVKSGIEETVRHSFSKHLEAYKSELTSEIERLKSSLKNDEVFFSRQLEALTKLRAIFRHLLPKKKTPEMDWHDACEDMAYSFSEHADTLDEFLCSYESVLPNEVLKDVESAISIATDGKFEFYVNDEEEIPQATRKAISDAERLYEAMKNAVSGLQRAVDSQIDSRRSG